MDPDTLECDLAEERGAAGALMTEVLIALGAEARAPGAELPAGTKNRGYWADSIEPDLPQTGSLTWLVAGAPASRDNLDRAEHYAALALNDIVAAGRARSIDVRAFADDAGALLFEVHVVAPDGTSAASVARVN